MRTGTKGARDGAALPAGTPLGTGAAWSRFVRVAVGAAGAVLCLVYGVVLGLDPFGMRTSRARPPVPIMDLNGRYMYPQLARSGLFDSAVFGTSTIRLLDPRQLDERLGGRFVNFGFNAGTPWEQIQIARLFLRHEHRPRFLVFGLDRTWCEPDADVPTKRITFRSFPAWLYDDSVLNDLPELLNLRSLEIAGRLLLHGLGLMPERVRGDGFEVFTPPESRYDLGRARGHIWAGTGGAIVPEEPSASLPAGEAQALRMPGLEWLASLLEEVPVSTRVLLLLPPVHVVSQPRPGSRDDAVERECKRRIAALAARRGSPVVDFRLSTALTSRDENFWDKLHYRLPFAGRIVEALARVAAGGGDDPDGLYAVPSR